jgi:ribosome-associated protein
MASRSRKGYYVDGTFIVAGSAEDRRFRAGLKDEERPSRGERKAASDQLQAIGAELVALGPDDLARVPLPERLGEAVAEARRITDFEGRRRQLQFVGKLMRRLDETELGQIGEGLRVCRSQSAQAARRLHQAEQWRDDLIRDDGALERWLREFPATDVRRLRALIRTARQETPPDAPRRHGRAFREIFALVRGCLDGAPVSS